MSDTANHPEQANSTLGSGERQTPDKDKPLFYRKAARTLFNDERSGADRRQARSTPKPAPSDARAAASQACQAIADVVNAPGDAARRAAGAIAAFDYDLNHKTDVACPVCGGNIIDCPHNLAEARAAIIAQHIAPGLTLTEDERETVKWMSEGCELPAVSFSVGPVRKLLAIITRAFPDSTGAKHG